MTNNAPAGTRAGSGLAVSLMYVAAGHAWSTVIWNYNATTGKWSFVRDDSILFALNGSELIMHVPFEYLPLEVCFPWCASVAAPCDETTTNGDSLPDSPGELIDCCDGDEPTVVPGTIEEPSPSEPNTEPIPSSDDQWPWLKILIATMFLGGGAVIISQGLDKKPKKQVAKIRPPNPMRKLKRNPVLDATVYWDFWDEKGVCCLKLSDIKRYRALIKEHEKDVIRELRKYKRKYEPPRICLKEQRAEDLANELKRRGVRALNDEELDQALEQDSSKNMWRYIDSIR